MSSQSIRFNQQTEFKKWVDEVSQCEQLYNKLNKFLIFQDHSFMIRAEQLYVVNIQCEDGGFDCEFTTTGNVEKVVFDYWRHMNNEHGIEYAPETLDKYVLKKIPVQIPAS